MHRIDSSGATSDNRFTDGDPTAGIAATIVDADYMNAIQEEIVAVIESAGIVLNKESTTQLKDAIEIMLAQWTPDATTTVAGILKLATQALALAGADNSTAMTPALVKAVVDACRASDADMATGTSTTKFPNVAQLVAAIDNIDSANLDLSNVSEAGQGASVGWGMPSNVYITLSNVESYTAPAHGYVRYHIESYSAANSTGNLIYVNDNIAVRLANNGTLSVIFYGQLPVAKGDVVTCENVTGLGNNYLFQFTYAIGSQPIEEGDA